MLKIGITGGIGSGKSTVCKLFSKDYSAPVFDCDTIAKYILNNNKDVKLRVIDLLGIEAYKDSELNRKFIAGIVFSNPDKLQKLNEIVALPLDEYWHSWIKDYEDSEYVIKEAAILFEMGGNHDLDFVINVYSDEETRIERVKERDSASEASIRARMKFQLPEFDRMKLSNFTILNGEYADEQSLNQQVSVLNYIFNNLQKKKFSNI
jgi:dephospho-CoA kinase